MLGLSDEAKVFLANRPDELGGTMNLLAAQIDELDTVFEGVMVAESDLQKRLAGT